MVGKTETNSCHQLNKQSCIKIGITASFCMLVIACILFNTVIWGFKMLQFTKTNCFDSYLFTCPTMQFSYPTSQNFQELAKVEISNLDSISAYMFRRFKQNEC